MNIYLICVGLLGLLYVGLSANVGRMRGAKKIFLGDGGDKELLSAIRAHANFMEFVPLCLLLLYILHIYYGYRTLVGLSILLTVARFLHAGGMLGYIPRGRTMGAIGTIIVLIVSSVWLGLIGLGIRLY
jgi:uncharacterized membrane protein YecN with MAPEG domain